MSKTEFTAHKLASIDRAAADQKLSDLGFRLLWLLSSAADRSTGVVRRRQTDLAQMLGVKARTVRRGLDHLVSRNYLEPIGVKPGKYISGYKILRSEKRTPESPFEKADISDQKEDISDQKEDIPYAHIPFISLDIPSDDRETDDRGPRRALKALGPLADREPELRDLLAERFKVLTMGEVIELTPDGELVIAAVTPGVGNMIRRDCEADLLAVTGANQLKIVVRLPSEALHSRRLQ